MTSVQRILKSYLEAVQQLQMDAEILAIKPIGAFQLLPRLLLSRMGHINLFAPRNTQGTCYTAIAWKRARTWPTIVANDIVSVKMSTLYIRQEGLCLAPGRIGITWDISEATLWWWRL